MQDLEAYSKWNPFIVKVDEVKGGSDVDGQFRLHVKSANGSEGTSWKRVLTKVSPVDDGSGTKTASWSYQTDGLMSHAVWGTRKQNLQELPDNRTRYVTEENFEGLLRKTVSLKDVEDGFERQAKALKARAELLYELERTHFPADVPVSRQTFENWARDIKVPNVLTCVPETPEDIVDIVNWGAKNGYKVRPCGMMHNWSPLTLSPTEDASKVLLVDMTQHLTKVVEPVAHNEEGGGTITVQAGITMEMLLTELQKENLGFIATPAPGDLTLGGVMAIAAHGTALPPVSNESPAKGHTYGSLSNSVLSLTAVVWNEQVEKYELRKFKRSDPECQVFLAHLGRAFITEMTLQAGPNQRLRCKSEMVPAAELYAPPGSSGRTFEKYMNENQGVEAIQFPGADEVWMKSWSDAPVKPPESREVKGPFNYTFSDNLPEALSALLPQVVAGAGRLTPAFGRMLNSIASAGLSLTNSTDLWGWSKDLLLYIKPDTLRVTANGYAIHTKRDNVQNIVEKFKKIYEETIKKYEERGVFPANGPLEIRVTGLDHAKEVSVDNAREPQLSPLRPDPTHPERDVAVYLDILTVPGTELSNEFYTDVEQQVFKEFNGPDSAVYVEWSKGWGYTKDGPWTNLDVMKKIIPNVLSEGRPKDDNFYTALKTLQKYDPKRLFSSPMLDKLLPHLKQGLESVLYPSKLDAQSGIVSRVSLGIMMRKAEEIWRDLEPEDRENILKELAKHGHKISADGQPTPSEGTNGLSVDGYVRLCDSKDGSRTFIAYPSADGKGKGRFMVVGPDLKASLVEDEKHKLKGRLSTKVPEQGRKSPTLK